MFNHGFGSKEARTQVHVNAVLPVVFIHVFQLVAGVIGSVINQYANITIDFTGFGYGFFKASDIAYVTLNKQHVCTVALRDTFDKGLTFLAVDVDKADFGALSTELLNHDFTNTGATTSDEYTFATQARILCVCIRRLDHNQMLPAVNDKNTISEMRLKIFTLPSQIH